MIMACNEIFEGCRDTDLFLLDTNKIKDAKLQARLVAAKGDDWFEVDDDEYEEIEEAKEYGPFPATVEKLLTIYTD